MTPERLAELASEYNLKAYKNDPIAADINELIAALREARAERDALQARLDAVRELAAWKSGDSSILFKSEVRAVLDGTPEQHDQTDA